MSYRNLNTATGMGTAVASAAALFLLAAPAHADDDKAPNKRANANSSPAKNSAAKNSASKNSAAKNARAQQAPNANDKQLVITTDARLTKFANIVLDVQKVDFAYRARIEAAKAPAEKEALLQQANRAMIDIISAHGLSPEEYRRLSEVVQTDKKVAQRFERIVMERQAARQKADDHGKPDGQGKGESGG